jgi:hypothetical protein
LNTHACHNSAALSLLWLLIGINFFLAQFVRLCLLPVTDLIVQPQFKVVCQSYELFINGIIIFTCIKGEAYNWTVFLVICLSWPYFRIIPTCYWIRTREHSVQENLVLNAVYCTVWRWYAFVAVFFYVYECLWLCTFQFAIIKLRKLMPAFVVIVLFIVFFRP